MSAVISARVPLLAVGHGPVGVEGEPGYL